MHVLLILHAMLVKWEASPSCKKQTHTKKEIMKSSLILTLSHHSEPLKIHRDPFLEIQEKDKMGSSTRMEVEIWEFIFEESKYN